jgi:hypothetical protein
LAARLAIGDVMTNASTPTFTLTQKLKDAFQNLAPFRYEVAGNVLSVVPEDIENVIEGGSSRLFLKTLKELKTGNPVFVDGNNFAIQDG